MTASCVLHAALLIPCGRFQLSKLRSRGARGPAPNDTRLATSAFEVDVKFSQTPLDSLRVFDSYAITPPALPFDSHVTPRLPLVRQGCTAAAPLLVTILRDIQRHRAAVVLLDQRKCKVDPRDPHSQLTIRIEAIGPTKESAVSARHARLAGIAG